MSESFSPPPSSEEWERLLAPISDDAPTGKYLNYETTYDDIREARREDDLHLPRSEWDTEIKKADWSKVYELCLTALINHTKDLQIAVWLTEALLHLQGYKGLKTGLQLLIQLCEHYWDNLFPPLETTDFELRLSPLIWLNHDNFIRQLGLAVPITAPARGDAIPYTFIDREKAKSLEKNPSSQKDTTAQAGKPTMTQFLTSATLTPRSFYTDLAVDLSESIDCIDKINQMLNEYCAEQAPSFGKCWQMLVDIQHAINLILADQPEANEPPLEPLAELPNQLPMEETDTKLDNPIGPIRNRSEAYQRLAEAADYLARTEPHSPTPYLVRRAITWGDMSLTALLSELVNDDKDLMAIYALLGIKDQPNR